MLNSNKLHI